MKYKISDYTPRDDRFDEFIIDALPRFIGILTHLTTKYLVYFYYLYSLIIIT